MAASFGLYFGNTNLCLAIHKDGNTEAVTNDSGDRVTPAVIAFSNGEKSVGLAAKSEMARNPSGTICNLKCLIAATSPEEVQKIASDSPCKIVAEGDRVHYEVSSTDNGRSTRHSCSDVLVYLFHKMFEVAESQGSDEYPAVVTVPPEFDEQQRQLVAQAPTKLSLSDHVFYISCSRYLLYRLGGQTASASIVAVCNGAYRLVAHASAQPALGGRDFTAAVVDHCAQEFKRQSRGADLRESRRALARLWNAAETAKHVLATLETAQCFAESVYEGMDLSLNISRARFESLLGSLLTRCAELVDEVLRRGSLEASDIHKVVLCGGSTKVRRLRSLLASRFPTSQLLDTHSPDEVIALGAAMQAALLSSRGETVRDVPHHVQVPALAHSVYIKTGAEGSLTEVLGQGTPVPARWQQPVARAESESSAMLEVYEGRGDGQDAALLARVCMDGLEEESKLVASVSIRSDGSVHISCTDKHSGRTESVTLDPTATSDASDTSGS
ncbi:heat shock 70 kDa protein 14 [Rhipicephalus sanguineus]|uniref:heat shock 70 kDa protein 14 n=1 Tax=Rhipicephalus sanguineus TaxID=34632 RepID=UPI0020C4F13F|nr:heat shock 70 kDa protein 14 [Rhipicephalus sanguineus]